MFHRMLGTIVIIWNLANVDFSKLIQVYRQTFTVTASWCTTIHYGMTNMYDIYLAFTCAVPRGINCKHLFVLQENPKYYQFWSKLKYLMDSRAQAQKLEIVLIENVFFTNNNNNNDNNNNKGFSPKCDFLHDFSPSY